MWEFAQDAVTEQLKVDQALLNISSAIGEQLWLYQLSDECVAVSFWQITSIKIKFNSTHTSYSYQPFF